MGNKPDTKTLLNDAIIKEIRDAAGSIEYGTVALKVHGGKIIQIEVTQKKRFDDAWKIEEGGGI